MKVLGSLILIIPLMAGCISSSNPPPAKTTTVIVPAESKTVVVCSDGTRAPCY